MLRYQAMQDYWLLVAPPLDVMIAGFMGWKADPFHKKRTSNGGQGTRGEEYGNLNDLLSMFPGGVI